VRRMVESTRTQGGGIGSVAETIARFRQRFLERIAAGQFELPMLPEVSTRVMSATQDENCDAKKLSDMIHRDAALAGHVLRIANSPLYAPTVPIVSLQQAVSRLGMKKIREIALLVACQAKVFKVPGFDNKVRLLFKHCVAAAAYAQEIARMRRWNVEESFLCGLLHDAGKPVLLQLLVDVQKEQKVGIEAGLVDDVLDEMHGSVGARLVESWKLPERLVETIACHHRPQDARSAGQSAMMTNMADDLAHFAVGPKTVTEAALRAHAMLTPLNLYRDELDTLIARKAGIVAAAEALL
jgi:putative nucleotidyltransferase with HDIG domain